jgi:hypothetical protein
MLLPTSSSADCARPPEPMLVQPLVAILGLSDHVKLRAAPIRKKKARLWICRLASPHCCGSAVAAL